MKLSFYSTQSDSVRSYLMESVFTVRNFLKNEKFTSFLASQTLLRGCQNFPSNVELYMERNCSFFALFGAIFMKIFFFEIYSHSDLQSLFQHKISTLVQGRSHPNKITRFVYISNVRFGLGLMLLSLKPIFRVPFSCCLILHTWILPTYLP